MNFDKVPEIDPTRQPRHRGGGRRVALTVLGLVVAGVLGGWWWVDRRAAVVEQTARAAAIEEMEVRLAEFEARLASPDVKTEARLALLTEGADLLTELVRLRGSAMSPDTRRRDDWLRQIDDLKANGLLARVREMEAAAERSARQGEVEAAAAAYLEASRLQRRVNDSNAGPERKNYVRETMLAQQAERVVVEPRAARLRSAIAHAEAAALAGDPGAALIAFRRAQELQVAINRDFPGSSYANRAEVDRMEARIASLLAAELDQQISTAMADARREMAEGRFDQAEKLLADAAERQRQLNRDFPRSSFVAGDRLDRIEVASQTARAGHRFREIEALASRTTGHLRRRELFQAQQTVRQAAGLLDAVTAAEPRAQGLDAETRLRLVYLSVHLEDLAPVQDRVHELLRPVPGAAGVAMLETEVTQALFTRLMNSNPSRNLGRELPVDSVTWAEAVEFCRRLGWVMGRTVRLPAAAELRAAAGGPAWLADNSSGTTQAVGSGGRNRAGFSDVTGNVAEWLAEAGASSEAGLVGGGSFATARTDAAEFSLQSAPHAVRNREIGFRVVVEPDPDGSGR